MSREYDDNRNLIPRHVLDAYVARFPHLHRLAENVRGGNIAAARSFAQNACRLEAPDGVSASDVVALAKVARP